MKAFWMGGEPCEVGISDDAPPVTDDRAALRADLDALVTDAIRSGDARCDVLRGDLADARRDAALWRLMFRAALDQLALVATQPERYEGMQRELRREREGMMAKELGHA